MPLVIRENLPAYLSDLKKWLCEARDIPLEEMDHFFTARIAGYEAHMACWGEAYRRLAQAVPGSCRRLLDLGCGTGLELDQIFERLSALEVTGIDLSGAMLAALRRKHPEKRLTLRCEDYFQAELGAEEYDAAVSFESLHHFYPEAKQGLFEKLCRALKPGGVYLECDYIACCEEEETLLRREYERKRGQSDLPEGKFAHFDIPLTLEHETALLRRAGFSQVEAIDSICGATLLHAVKPSR